MCAYCSSLFLRPRSLVSSLGTGAQSNLISASIRGTNDSIARLFAFVRWDTCKPRGQRVREEAHTSQVSRTKQRPPATDLSGPKASAESLTPRRSNFAAADAVDLQFDPFSFAAAFGSAFSFGTRPGIAEASTLSEGVIRRVQQLKWKCSRTAWFPSSWRGVNSLDFLTGSTIHHNLGVRVQA